MTTLDAKAILGTVDLERREVAVPEWGGSVFMTQITSADRDAFEHKLHDAGGMFPNMRAHYVALCLVDNKGNRLFKADKDILALGKKCAVVVDRLWDVANQMNATGADAIEDAIKN